MSSNASTLNMTLTYLITVHGRYRQTRIPRCAL